MSYPGDVIMRDPEILGGMPVFRGTRVPFKNLLDYLEGGHTLDEFLEEFPSVTREAAIAALESAKELVIAEFDPVEISGEPLSETILRERR